MPADRVEKKRNPSSCHQLTFTAFPGYIPLVGPSGTADTSVQTCSFLQHCIHVIALQTAGKERAREERIKLAGKLKSLAVVRSIPSFNIHLQRLP
jgi:hypothetical protein